MIILIYLTNNENLLAVGHRYSRSRIIEDPQYFYSLAFRGEGVWR